MEAWMCRRPAGAARIRGTSERRESEWAFRRKEVGDVGSTFTRGSNHQKNNGGSYNQQFLPFRIVIVQFGSTFLLMGRGRVEVLGGYLD